MHMTTIYKVFRNVNRDNLALSKNMKPIVLYLKHTKLVNIFYWEYQDFTLKVFLTYLFVNRSQCHIYFLT